MKFTEEKLEQAFIEFFKYLGNSALYRMVQVFHYQPMCMQAMPHPITNTPLSPKPPSTNKRKYLIVEDF
ncbi:MAG: hypothetical protein K8R53_14785 [Bacteroidales bacterium]|nr:hypothetical protein [Bacteroidales bacterium]